MNKIQKKVLKQVIKDYNLKHVISVSDLSQLKENYNFAKGIYMIFFIDEEGNLKYYIGSAENMAVRIRTHKSSAICGYTTCRHL